MNGSRLWVKIRYDTKFFHSVACLSVFTQLNRQFGEDWARLTRDLLFDSEGSLKFKPHLWNDIRKVILPQLIEQVSHFILNLSTIFYLLFSKVRYVPIPRIEYTDESLDLVVENLTLQGQNLFPNIIEMEAHNFVKFSPYNGITDDHNHHMTLSLHQIQADMRNVAFYYRKKTGIPKMSDSGIADVLLGGEGLSVSSAPLCFSNIYSQSYSKGCDPSCILKT